MRHFTWGKFILFCSLSGILIPYPAVGQTGNSRNGQPEDSGALYVKTLDGLNLRETPNPNSGVLEKLSYKQKVLLQNKKKLPVRIDELDGNWVFVAAAEKRGWVFDGYLEKDLSIIDDISVCEGKFVLKDIHVTNRKNDDTDYSKVLSESVISIRHKSEDLYEMDSNPALKEYTIPGDYVGKIEFDASYLQSSGELQIWQDVAERGGFSKSCLINYDGKEVVLKFGSEEYIGGEVGNDSKEIQFVATFRRSK